MDKKGTRLTGVRGNQSTIINTTQKAQTISLSFRECLKESKKWTPMMPDFGYKVKRFGWLKDYPSIRDLDLKRLNKSCYQNFDQLTNKGYQSQVRITTYRQDIEEEISS